MEGCTHLLCYKKYKKKLIKFISQENEYSCAECRSGFQIHKCLDCEYSVCFNDMRLHTFDNSKEKIEKEKKEIRSEDSSNKVESHKKTEIATGFLLNNFEFVNQNEDDLEEKRDENVKRLKKSSDTSDSNTFENCKNLFFNQQFNCIYCSICKKYLNFGKILEMAQQKRFLVKNQKQYQKMTNYYIKGIINLGNTCYMNSILQIFINSDSIKERLCDTSHEKMTCQNETCVICALKCMYIDCYNPLLPIVNNEFLYAFIVHMKGKYNSEQFDSHEFFLDLCQVIHDQTSIGNKECHCLIHDIFEGTTASTLKCQKCEYTSVKKESFFSLSLGLKESVQDAFDHFFEGDIPEQVQCQNCKNQETTNKQVGLEKIPKILVVHLKRYFNAENLLLKDESKIEISRILTTKNAHSEKIRSYRLFGAICHIGKLNYGHYVSFVMTNNQWMKFDDEKVDVSSFGELSENLQYVFFYMLE